MAAPNAWNADFPEDVIYDVGIVTHEVATVQTVVGMTRDGANAIKGDRWRQPVYDGQRHRVAGMTRSIGWEDTRIEGNFVQVPSAIMAKFLAGSSSVTVGLVTTHTPAAAGSLIALSGLLVKPTITWNRGSGGTAAIQFYYGFVDEWNLTARDKDEAVAAVRILAEVDPAMVGYNSNLPPYKLIVTEVA